MRVVFLPILLLAACSTESETETEAPSRIGIHAGPGRDRMCIARSGEAWRVGIVTYGEGDNNCTFRGKVVVAEHGMLVEALGDPDCRLLIEKEGETSRIGVPTPEACEYYCGPSATLSGRSFTHAPNASPAIDFAGDPLC
jgi:hypothetical protein